MLIGLCAAAIFFPICLLLWQAERIEIVPWLRDGANVKGIFLCFSSIYVPMFPGVYAFICHRKGAFSKPGNRLIAAFLVGASLGVFIAAMGAIFGDDGSLREIQTPRFERILAGAAPEEVVGSARKLFGKAEVLSMLLPFVDCCLPNAIDFGIIAVLVVLLYDRISAIKQLKTKP